MTPPITFFVAGTPKPQGSKRAFMRPGAKHPTMLESAGDALKDWRASVRYTAATQGKQVTGAVRVSLEFRMARPKGHFRTGKHSDRLREKAPYVHTKKPDVDKLSRAVLDALTNVVFEDDSCVIELQALKRYVNTTEQCGCRIRVEGVR